MKELSIEEKAQRYDDAINAIKELKAKHPTALVIKDWIKENFPELKESEDERIRKELIDFLEYYRLNNVLDSKIIFLLTDSVAWLEKQGTPAKLSEEEQNRFAKGVLTSCAMSFIDYLDAHKYEGKMCVSNGECEDIENAFLNAMWDRLHRYYCKYIEKQGEKEDATKDKIAEYLKKLILDQSQRGAHMLDYEGRIEEEVDFIINIAKKELKLEEQGEQKEATCVAEIIDRLSEKEQEILFKELNMQKEHNKFIESIQIGDQVTRNQDGILVNLSQLKRVAKPSEKQGEKKPADEVEPKFHEGDWIVIDRPCQIISINDNGDYIVQYCDDENTHILSKKFCESYFHIWTIRDTKAGDVLACNNGWTCIFKTLVNDETFSSYCFMDNTKWFCETGSEAHTLKEEFVKAYNGKIYPATKEQRDTLMMAMADAGYEWNAEKKELKKIERKLAWSEEDKNMLQSILDEYGSMQIEKRNWLKSLKSRVQLKQEWNEEDDSRMDNLCHFLEEYGEQYYGHLTLQGTISWLKSLKPNKQWKPTEDAGVTSLLKRKNR